MPQASAAMRPIVASVSAAMGARQLMMKRSFATAQKQCSVLSRAQSARSQINSQQLRSSFRRSYADSTGPVVSPTTKKKGWRTLRWMWRATYISTIAGIAWVAYGIVETKNPPEQEAPDPSKKTLVVLGMHQFPRLIRSVYARVTIR